MARRGIRVSDLTDKAAFEAMFDLFAAEHAALCPELDRNWEETRRQYHDFADRIRPMACDTATLLNKAILAGKYVMFEGAQGTMLDIDHGSYPFVTSSSASAGGACTGTGVGPTRINGVIGVSKAYITRVGGGPFPTEDFGDAGRLMAKRGNEFGSVTGRPRRCGWFDVPLLRYTAAINGFDSLVVTKLDVLDEFEQIPVCVGYRIGGKEIYSMPPTAAELAEVEPVYDYLPGWQTSTFGITRYEELPAKAKEYLTLLEAYTDVEIGCVSTGPEREQTIVIPGSRLAKLVRA
jgi:adenylosuccinate synthase